MILWVNVLAQTVKRPPAMNAKDPDSVPGFGRSSGEGNGHPYQNFGLENSIDSGAWRATGHHGTKSQTLLGD